jgi:predicted dehydrogenase/nucleoside-diphosphate-sugar epimerase
MKYIILGGGSVVAEYYLPALRLMGRLGDATVVDIDPSSIRLCFAEVAVSDRDHTSFFNASTAAGPDDAVCAIVALPNQLHVGAVRLALEHGYHVLCEKPLALRASDCGALRSLAVRRNQLLKVAMSRRYLPSMMLARDIIAAGELGEVRAIEIRDCVPFPWRPRSFAFFSREAGGVLADMGIHYLDFLDTLVGPLTPRTYEDDAKGGIESSLCFCLTAADIPIDMKLSRLHRSGAWMKIACERGGIRIDKDNETEVLVTPAGEPSRRVSIESPFDQTAWPRNFHGSFCQMLADFEGALSGRVGRIADVADAERAASLVEWAYGQRVRMPAAPKDTSQAYNHAKVLVTGGTGFVGGHLVERLSLGGCAVRVAARTPATCANVSRFPIEIVPVDLLDRESVTAALADARTVYHLAYGSDGVDPTRTTIEGTKNIIEVGIAAGAECVVVLSTMYVFGLPDDGPPIDESFPYRPYGGKYGRSKAAMERWCLERAKTSLPTRVVILNPTCVFGPGGGAYTSLPVDLAREGRFCWIDEGRGLCNYNYVENLIDAIVAAARVPEAHGSRLIINDGAVSWREFLGPLVAPVMPNVPSLSPSALAQMSRNKSRFRISDLFAAAIASPEIREIARRSSLARKAAASLQHFKLARPANSSTVNGHQRETAELTPPEWLASLYSPARPRFSAQKAEQVLGWKPRVTLAEAQSTTLQWLIEDGRLPAPRGS